MSKRILTLITMSIFLCAGADQVFAQKYPDRPITLVLPMAPGDGLDLSGRVAAEELSKILKVPVIPLNKPGASATLGADMVAKAKKDGYTLLLANHTAMISTKILEPETVPYDPFKDFAPLGFFNTGVFMIGVRGDAPYKNLKEFIEYAKKSPQKPRCGTLSARSITDLNVAMLHMITGLQMDGVPFKGSPQVVSALLGGHLEAISLSIIPAMGFLKSGEVRGIAISRPFPDRPEISTLKQLGYKDNLLENWGAFYAPAGVPPEVIATLVPAIEKVVRDPAVTAKVTQLGAVEEYLSPDKLLAKMQEEYRMVMEISKRFGLK